MNIIPFFAVRLSIYPRKGKKYFLDVLPGDLKIVRPA